MRKLRRIIAAAIIMGGTTTAVIAADDVASAGSCPTRSTKQAFKAWGDYNQYFVVPSGTFESGATGWAMYGGGSVVNDQAPWKVNGSTHSKALRLPAYTTAMPPNMCIASNEEWMRFFFRDPGTSGATLLVKIEAWNSAGTNGRVVQEYRIGSSKAGWKVSPQIPMPNNRDSSGEQWITLTFTPIGTAASWTLDDVMIDPWIAR